MRIDSLDIPIRINLLETLSTTREVPALGKPVVGWLDLTPLPLRLSSVDVQDNALTVEIDFTALSLEIEFLYVYNTELTGETNFRNLS